MDFLYLSFSLKRLDFCPVYDIAKYEMAFKRHFGYSINYNTSAPILHCILDIESKWFQNINDIKVYFKWTLLADIAHLFLVVMSVQLITMYFTFGKLLPILHIAKSKQLGAGNVKLSDYNISPENIPLSHLNSDHIYYEIYPVGCLLILRLMSFLPGQNPGIMTNI